MEIDYEELKKGIEKVKEVIRDSHSDFEKLRAYITLGNSYILLSEFENTRDNIVNALLAFDDAFLFAKKFESARDLAEIEMQKGFVFYKLAFIEEREYNLEKSIEHFSSSLNYLKDVAESTSKIVKVKYNLANAYLAVRGPAFKESIQKGIKELEEILSISDIDEETKAMVNSALGVGYLVYAKADSGKARESLYKGKEYFIKARDLFSENQKFDKAAAENGIGTVCLELALINDDPIKNLKEAIAHFEMNLSLYTVDSTPYDFASTHYNLGLTYFNLSRFSDLDKVENLENTVFHFERALEVYTEEEAPRENSRINYQKGVAYRELYIAQQNSIYLEREVECFEKTLEEVKPEDEPYTYIIAHFYLGEASYFLGETNKALEHYNEALRIAETHDGVIAKQIREVIEIVSKNE